MMSKSFKESKRKTWKKITAEIDELKPTEI